jgi:hypothetical protein
LLGSQLSFFAALTAHVKETCKPVEKFALSGGRGGVPPHRKLRLGDSCINILGFLCLKIFTLMSSTFLISSL